MMSYDREQRVRERAHALWEAAGRPEGRTHEFWLWAEKLVAEDRGSTASQSTKTPPP